MTIRHRGLLIESIQFADQREALQIADCRGAAWHTQNSNFDIYYNFEDRLYLVVTAEGFLSKCFHPDKVISFVPLSVHKVTAKEVPFDRGQVRKMLATDYITKSTAAKLSADISD